MLDSGSKQTLIGFSCLEKRHSPGLRCSFLIHDDEAWRAALGKWKYSARKVHLNSRLRNLTPPRSSYLGLEGLHWRCVGRWRWRRLDPAGPHVGEELVGDLSQDIFGEPGHAQDVVSRPVDVVPEWDKLRRKGKI